MDNLHVVSLRKASEPSMSRGSASSHNDFASATRRRTPETSQELLERTSQFAEELAARPNRGNTAAPLEELRRCAELGLLIAPLSRDYGGLGLGTEPGGHRTLLRLLALLGGADLALARLYEGHVSGQLLVHAYGSPEQMEQAARDSCDGMLFGVWNTGSSEPLRLTGGPHVYQYKGSKTFASGAGFVRRPIVTADLPGGGGWQMTLPRMESQEVAGAIAIDKSSWRAPWGMVSSEKLQRELHRCRNTRLRLDRLAG